MWDDGNALDDSGKNFKCSCDNKKFIDPELQDYEYFFIENCLSMNEFIN